MSDQYTFQNPVQVYKYDSFPKQQQSSPGLETDMSPKPDAGETSYRGTGRLAGRKALITGADSGIGRAVAIAFAREGADIVLAYLPSEEPDADEVVKLIEAEGRKAIKAPGDLTDETYCTALVKRAVDELGGLDALVSVAGAQEAIPDIADLTTEHFDHVVKTNIYAMFWLCKAAIAVMPPGSTIVNTTSLQAYHPSPTLVDYAMTKAAINTFTKSLAQQVAKKGIRVNAVAPGPVWTPLQVSGGQPADKLPDFGKQTPLGRAGQPAELAPAYVFLTSAESSFSVGATISATGGEVTP